MTIEMLATDTMGGVLLATREENIFQTICYSPFGKSNGGSAGITTPGFNGERLDPVSNTYHLGNGYRAYNPLLMRFNCPDSFSPFGAGGVNAYAYCGGDPINNADPSGHLFGLKALFIGLLDSMASVLTATEPEGALLGESADVALGRMTRGGVEYGGTTGPCSAILGDRAAYARGEPVHLSGDISKADKAAAKQLKAYSHPGEKWGNPLPQIPADPHCVGRLLRTENGSYEVENLLTGERTIPHGNYLYVNRVDEPHVIRIAGMGDVKGHTSMTQLPRHYEIGLYQAGNVYYAGEMQFEDGVMTARSNGSGHYTPDIRDANSNMLPSMCKLLEGVAPSDQYFRYEVI